MGTVEENKEVIRRLVEEIYDKGDLSVVPEFIDPNYNYIHPMGLEIKGTEGFSQFIQMLHSAFSNYHMTLDDMMAENDKVGITISLSGTLTGKFGEYEPTGNTVNLTEAMFFTLRDGKVIEQKAFTDGLSFMQQAGINPFE
ncbi:ester cyclase [Chloroflexota bacterium]